MGRQAQMKAPYVSKGYMEKFLQLIKRVRLNEINAATLLQYGTASPGNESKMLAALRFLKIISPDGKINDELINKLKLEGESYQQSVKQMVESAYEDVFKSILDLNMATENDLKNHFTTKYNYSQQQSKMASLLFVYLCELAGIQLSDELTNMGKSKPRVGHTRIKQTKSVKPNKIETSNKTIIQARNNVAHGEIPIEGYAFSITGKNFSLHQVIKNKKELEKLIKTIEINCEFKE